ncbi:helix-turn-helix domain-containing protein [Enterobacter wuhouensis]|uniref:helix-turn-helix domain-containing protein n=1 Tax=Enterobacter wuhouensis TaxID=2529381 RepID=UPI0021E557B3|nr:helix-turn-helix domain-containing protein [Enterobacter wuhouensis]MCV2532222.1 helix-turn-helix domain-containing protein [Enterobacter wuhouensis]
MIKKQALLPTNQPSPYETILVEQLSPYAKTKEYPVRVRIYLKEQNEQQCILLLKGALEVHRLDDDLIVTTINAPSMIGLSVRDVYVVTAQPCRLATLSLDRAHSLIAEKDLWSTLAMHLQVINSKLFAYSKRLSAPTAYEMICHQLHELMSEPETFRTSITAERYIREKTHLSRSGVMKILSTLKNDEAIVLNDGRLVEIKHLPIS